MKRILAVGVLVFLGFMQGVQGEDGKKFGDWGKHEDGPKFGDWGTPVNLGPVVNSPSYDACPTISKDGLSLYFRSNRTDLGGYGGFDIYVSQRDSLEDPWEAPVNLGPTINGLSDEFCSAFSVDGHWMIFVSNRSGGVGNQDLWISHRKDKRDDFGWETPINLGAPINSTAAENGPCLFNDEVTGKTFLYFSSARPTSSADTTQDMNIWVSEGSLEHGNIFFEPPKLVTELSFDGTDNRYPKPAPILINDYQPTIRKDGLEIIFASNRFESLYNELPGVGPDLWVATRESTSDPWSEPKNLGAVVNSVVSDFHPTLSWDGTTLIFASDRGTPGSADLYMTTRSKLRGPNGECRERREGEREGR
jgi:hypothetical protein